MNETDEIAANLTQHKAYVAQLKSDLKAAKKAERRSEPIPSWRRLLLFGWIKAGRYAWFMIGGFTGYYLHRDGIEWAALALLVLTASHVLVGAIFSLVSGADRQAMNRRLTSTLAERFYIEVPERAS